MHRPRHVQHATANRAKHLTLTTMHLLRQIRCNLQYCTVCSNVMAARLWHLPQFNTWSGLVQDIAAEMEDDLYGYADSSKLQVRGTEQKWVLK